MPLAILVDPQTARRRNHLRRAQAAQQRRSWADHLRRDSCSRSYRKTRTTETPGAGTCSPTTARSTRGIVRAWCCFRYLRRGSGCS
jgi:hypothetical protein